MARRFKALCACGFSTLVMFPSAVAHAQASGAVATTQPGPRVARDDVGLQARLDAIAAELETQRDRLSLPGLSVAIVVDDTVVMARGFGRRDLERDLPATADTIYAVGSVTKAFTSTLIAMLVDEGLMTWDDPVRTHLPEVRFRDDTLDEGVTIRDLLAHRTGFMGMDLLWYLGDATWDDIVPCLRRAVPTTGVGERWQYNNIMYLLAGRAAAAATPAADDTWSALVEGRLLQPLGMAHSSTSVTSIDGEVHAAIGYTPSSAPDAEQHPWTPIARRPLQNVAPAGAINSNVLDMANWIRFQLQRGTKDGTSLVSRAHLEETWRRHIAAAPGVGYGLGWMTADWNGHRLIEHGGNIDGFSAHVAILPDAGIGCVMLANATATSFPALAKNIVFDRMMEDRADDAGDSNAGAQAEVRTPLVGRYRFPLLQVDVTVMQRDASLVVDIPGQMAYELNPPDENGRRSFRGFEHIAVAFDAPVNGVVEGMSLHQAGEVFRLPRIGLEPKAATPVATDVQAYFGRYRFEPMNAEFEARMEHGRLVVDVPGQMAYALNEPDDAGWRTFVAVPSIAVRFDPDVDGRVDALILRQMGQEHRLPKLGGDEPLPTADDVMEIVHLSLGSPAYHELPNLHGTGTIEFVNQGVRGDIQMLIAGFDRYLMRAEFEPFGWMQVAWISWMGWRDSPFAGYEELDGVALEQVKLQHPAILLTDWANFFSDVRTIRVDQDGDEKVFVLRAVPRDGAPVQTLFIRARDGHLLRSEGEREFSPGVQLPVVAEYADYRRVEGVALPFRVTTEDAINGRVTLQFSEMRSAVPLKDEPWFMNEQGRDYPTLSEWWVGEPPVGE